MGKICKRVGKFGVQVLGELRDREEGQAFKTDM